MKLSSKTFSTVERIWKTAPNAKIAINTNGTRLLREKDLAKLRHIQGIKIRLSVDGWGPRRIYKAGHCMGRKT